MYIQCKNPNCQNTFEERGVKAFCSDKCRRAVRGYAYRKAREIALWRDSNECVECGIEASITHHVIPVSVDASLAADPNNLETRCFPCHVKIHAEMRREDEERQARFTESEVYANAA
jgi:5-methylcytosine-specific restriction endonuclease McrA